MLPVRLSVDPSAVVRPMVRAELDVLVEWAAAEGWNPGLDDADVFWATDPEGFVALEVGGELAGGGSIVSYDGRYGFMGFFLVRVDLRHAGLGRELWPLRRDLLRARLEPGAAIEMDGVFAMQAFYERGGFVLEHRDLRFEGTGAGDRGPVPGVVDVADLGPGGLEAVEAYDTAHVAAPRPRFLAAWLARPGGHAVAVVDGDRCRGFAVARPCRTGHRIGPLFADDPGIAEDLYLTLAARTGAGPRYLDVPERNADAMALAERHHLTEVFGCARMVLGPAPDVPWDEIYGVTTFELG